MFRLSTTVKKRLSQKVLQSSLSLRGPILSLAHTPRTHKELGGLAMRHLIRVLSRNFQPS